jgi:hypothetical protein
MFQLKNGEPSKPPRWRPETGDLKAGVYRIQAGVGNFEGSGIGVYYNRLNTRAGARVKVREMPILLMINRAFLLMIALLLAAPARAAAPPSPEAIDYFEKNIRPILVDTCYKCHSAQSEKLKGGLYVDSPYGLRTGGKTGPAIVPGEPEKSLLIKAVRYGDEELQMPPKEQLSKEQIAALETWVKMGAPDPRPDPATARNRVAEATPPAATKLSLAESKDFWSFKRPVMAAVPVVKGDWAKSPVDAFVIDKLVASGMQPAAAADKRTLIRRATFDLTGLPPTAADVAAFEADNSANAFEKVLDRLLASPAYGQRWARHWLDVARYADTKGYVFQEERRYPFAYTYRDWVVSALNLDMPYDQFLINQIAADRVVAEDPKADKANLAAMGFLTVGRRFLNNQSDIIDDRLDVLSRGTMGLTVACARCHDHKFDPIPAADYYSLYGVFASSSEPKDPPLLTAGAEKSPQTIEYEKELATREAAIVKFKEDRLEKAVVPLKSAASIQAYLLAASKPRGAGDASADNAKLNRFAIRRWRTFLDETAASKDAVFAPWHKLAALPEKEFAVKASEVLAAFTADEKKPLNPELAKALSAKPLGSLADVASAYASFLEVEIANPKSAVATAPNFPTNISLANVESVFTGDDRGAYNGLLQKRDAVTATHPGAPARAMVMVDAPTPVNPVIFKRGNPGMPGAAVPRQFLACVAGDARQPFKEGSGRLELARAIASKDNPLTARVFVNRVWLQHFGKALVRTPSDFGIRGERPTHPELLDYLAVNFMQNGWSIKRLHKTIMLSAAYQQSSVASVKALQDDSENRLISHQNRQRLDFEAMRDSLLFASGQLDQSVGGRAVDILAQPFSHRRTIYGFIDRQNLPSMFRAFDFASPDQHAPMRFANTVPQQALFMMNSPFIIEQSRALAGGVASATLSPEQKICTLYQKVFARNPSQDEIKLGLSFINAEASPSTLAASHAPLWQYGYGAYDESAQRVSSFTPLPFYTGAAWQGGKALPDPKLGYCLLTPQGGHAGNDLAHAVVRRWTAPRDGAIAVSGTLAHTSANGDGVRGRVVSSRIGELASLTVHNKSAQTQLETLDVKAGETLDFIVDCRASVTSDSFTWPVIVKMKNLPEGIAGGEDTLEWNSVTDFAGPQTAAPMTPLSPWEKYAQILLETNEFVFID